MNSYKLKVILTLVLGGILSLQAFAADNEASKKLPVFALTNGPAQVVAGVGANRQEGRDTITELSNISVAPSQMLIDFAAGQREVSGFQLDIRIESVSEVAIDLSDCVSGIPDSHQGFCREIEPGLIRLLVDSPFNGNLDTSNIGVIEVSGGAFEASIVPSSVVAGDSSGVKVEAEVL